MSRRELVSATYEGAYHLDATMRSYIVEYRWVPTRVGWRVRRDLTGNTAVEEGDFRTKVWLRSGRDLADPSAWYVDQVGGADAERIR